MNGGETWEHILAFYVYVVYLGFGNDIRPKLRHWYLNAELGLNWGLGFVIELCFIVMCAVEILET